MRTIASGVVALMCAALAAGISLQSAGATWGSGVQSTKDDGALSTSCGDITGSVGCCWGGFTPSGAGTDAMSTEGQVGVRWHTGDEPDIGSLNPDPASKVNYVTHQYVGDTSGVTVACVLWTISSLGGSCSKCDEELVEWHWTWAGSAEQRDPVRSYWTGSQWTTVATFSSGSITTDVNGALAASANSGSVNGSSTEGDFDASEYVFGVSAVKVTATFDSECTSASADNCSVVDNFLKMTFTFLTSVE